MTQDYPPSPASSPPNNPLSIASLASGLAAWVIGGLGSCAMFFIFFPLMLCTWILFLGGSIAAALMGHVARRQIQQSAGAQTGEGLAMTGLVLGWAGVAATVLTVCVALIGIVALGPAIGSIYSELILTVTAQAP